MHMSHVNKGVHVSQSRSFEQQERRMMYDSDDIHLNVHSMNRYWASVRMIVARLADNILSGQRM